MARERSTLSSKDIVTRQMCLMRQALIHSSSTNLDRSAQYRGSGSLADGTPQHHHHHQHYPQRWPVMSQPSAPAEWDDDDEYDDTPSRSNMCRGRDQSRAGKADWAGGHSSGWHGHRREGRQYDMEEVEDDGDECTRWKPADADQLHSAERWKGREYDNVRRNEMKCAAIEGRSQHRPSKRMTQDHAGPPITMDGADLISQRLFQGIRSMNNGAPLRRPGRRAHDKCDTLPEGVRDCDKADNEHCEESWTACGPSEVEYGVDVAPDDDVHPKSEEDMMHSEQDVTHETQQDEDLDNSHHDAEIDAPETHDASNARGKLQPRRLKKKKKWMPVPELAGGERTSMCPPDGANYAMARALADLNYKPRSFCNQAPPFKWDKRLHIDANSYSRRHFVAAARPKVDVAATNRLIRFTMGRPPPEPLVQFKGRGMDSWRFVTDDGMVDYGGCSAHALPLRSEAKLRRPSL